mgnify:CR=1 FL=1
MSQEIVTPSAVPEIAIVTVADLTAALLVLFGVPTAVAAAAVLVLIGVGQHGPEILFVEPNEVAEVQRRAAGDGL